MTDSDTSVLDKKPEGQVSDHTDASNTVSNFVSSRVALSPSTSLAAALSVWIESRRMADLSANTIKNYGHDIQLLAKYVGGGVAVGQLTTQILNNYLDWMRNQRGVPCSNKTLDRRITSLKSFFRWLTPAASLVEDPAQAVVNVSVRSPLPVILTNKDVDQALDAANLISVSGKKPDVRPVVLFTLLLQTGLRKGETARLVTNHLDFSDHDHPHLYVRYSDKRHRHKERKVSVEPSWVITYRRYADKHNISERVFPWSVRRLEYLLEDITNTAGLNKHVSFEMLRWTCATRDHMAGMEPEKLRRKIGVSKVQWVEVHRKILKLAQ